MFFVRGSRALNLVTLLEASHLYIFWMFRVPPGASLRLRSLCNYRTSAFQLRTYSSGRRLAQTHAALDLSSGTWRPPMKVHVPY